MTDQDRPIDQSIIEHARDVVREILDRHATRVARGRSSTMSSVVRMQPKPIGEVLAQVSPRVPVAANSVAKEHRR